MEPAIVSQIIIGLSTIIAGLGAYVVAGRNERRRDVRAMQREETAYKARRAEESGDKRRAFQLENLIAQQDAVQLMARLNGRAMHFDHMQARKHQYVLLPPTWSEEMYDNAVNVSRLASRVLDDEIRTKVKEFTRFAATLNSLPKEFEGLSDDGLETCALRKFDEMNHQFESVISPLGEQIRSALAG